MLAAYARRCGDLCTVMANWRALQDQELVAFNAVLTRNNLKPVAAAVQSLQVPGC
jgi:hypothetical protein